MGQTDKYIERTFKAPPVVVRVFWLVLPIVYVVQAIHTPSLENIMWAVLFALVMLPAAVGPKTFPAALGILERKYPLLGYVFMFLVVGCATFVLLTNFLDRKPSAAIALALPLLFIPAAHLLRRRRAARVSR